MRRSKSDAVVKRNRSLTCPFLAILCLALAILVTDSILCRELMYLKKLHHFPFAWLRVLDSARIKQKCKGLDLSPIHFFALP